MTHLLHNNYLSFRQLKHGESHMTYLARNMVNPLLILYSNNVTIPKEMYKTHVKQASFFAVKKK
jgi:hypothetical protein